jgi:hypothetical protein
MSCFLAALARRYDLGSMSSSQNIDIHGDQENNNGMLSPENSI